MKSMLDFAHVLHMLCHFLVIDGQCMQFSVKRVQGTGIFHMFQAETLMNQPQLDLCVKVTNN